MEKFTVLTGIAAPLMVPNIDTDKIIRIERMAKYGKGQLGAYALEMLRYRADGTENPDCVLNRAPYRDAKILLAADNFGCGSSRENAVWALIDRGLRAVIAPSFGDIFYGNCFQNGLLPIRLPRPIVEGMAQQCLADPLHATITVDLIRQVVTPEIGAPASFEIESLRRTMLLEGLDDIGLTLTHDAAIAGFQSQDRAMRPWLYGADR
jgi:3-isopropylmalate/(R)-2-methylmalate dehydratase small subunit